MRIRKALAAVTMGVMLTGGMAACGSQDGCYEDGERVSCNYDDDDRDYDDDDRRERDDDDGWEDDD